MAKQSIVKHSRELVLELDNTLSEDFSVTMLIPPNAREFFRFKSVNSNNINQDVNYVCLNRK